MREAAASPLAVSRTARTTCAPRPTRPRAASKPMPLFAPVITNVRPVCSGSCRTSHAIPSAYDRVIQSLVVQRIQDVEPGGAAGGHDRGREAGEDGDEREGD